MKVKELPVDELQPRADARLVHDARVQALKQSIEDNGGLINPVRVRHQGFYYEVIAGWHRTVAYRQLGWPKIPCVVVDDDELRAKLAMIDENIYRTQLSLTEEDAAIKERKKIYEALFPEAAAGRKRARAMNVAKGNKVTDKDVPSFTEATAAATGKSKREVQRALRRADIDPRAIAYIGGTRLDTKEFRDELAGVPYEDQPYYALEAVHHYKPPPSKNPITRAYETATDVQKDEFLSEIGYRLPWPSISAP